MTTGIATEWPDAFLVPTTRLSAVSVTAPSPISIKVVLSSEPRIALRLISVTSTSASVTTSADGLVASSLGTPAVN